MLPVRAGSQTEPNRSSTWLMENGKHRLQQWPGWKTDHKGQYELATNAQLKSTSLNIKYHRFALFAFPYGVFCFKWPLDHANH